MKKRVTFLAALLVAACFGATVAMAEGSAKVTAQSGLNMRQGPGINYNVVTVLNNGATVNVVTPDDGNGWAYVTSGKNAGWVATKYLSGSAATTQAPSWRGSAVNCTVKSDANIRRGPGTDFGVLGVVPAGFTVSVDSYQDGWASVTWGDVSGYIATKLLNGLPAANGGTSTASNSTSGRYEGADVTCTLNSDANLRSGPATSYEVLTAVPAGFTVTVHSYANGSMPARSPVNLAAVLPAALPVPAGTAAMIIPTCTTTAITAARTLICAPRLAMMPTPTCSTL